MPLGILLHSRGRRGRRLRRRRGRPQGAAEVHRGVAATGVGAEEDGAEQSHRNLRIDGVEVAAAIPRRRRKIWLVHCDSRCAVTRLHRAVVVLVC